MTHEVVDKAPVAGDFTLLSEHQEQTPTTFFGGKPILHLHCHDAKLKISKTDLSSQPDFAALSGIADSDSDDEALLEILGIDVWVTSKYFTIFSSAQSKGVQISYPTISIHAQDGDAVLLELNLSDPNASDDEMVFLQLRIVPQSIEKYETSNGDHPNGTNDKPATVLYNAISACQELNPDAPSDDEDQGFDETAPDATGWITSENMQDFMDEDGNFRVPEGVPVIGGEDDAVSGGLGEGAGRRRTAAEAGEEDDGDDDGKWQRTG